jgi:hypothetical protein
LQIAPSTYYAVLTRPPSARAVGDEELEEMIDKIYREKYRCTGRGRCGGSYAATASRWVGVAWNG